MMHRYKLSSTVLVVWLLSACAVEPQYGKPNPLVDEKANASLIARYKEATEVMRPANPSDQLPRQVWWTAFNDPVASTLLEQLAASNQTLAAAQATYRQALSAQAQSRSALFPALTVNSAATRSNSGVGAQPVNAFNVNLGVSWEVDLWGRVSQNVLASSATAQASAADLSSIHLSLQTQLLSSYINYRFADQQASLLAAALTSYEKTLELTRNRYKAGVAAQTDVVQAQLQMHNAKAQWLDMTLQRSQFEHAIATLAGTAPATLTLEPNVQFSLKLPEIAADIPAQMLERRPDIAAAERRMAAANAQIGVTKAALFPAITLSATGGYRGTALSDLLTWPHRIWSLGPTLAFSLFDGGQRSAANDQAIAAYDLAVANYRQTILTALQQVEDGLASQRILKQEYAVQQVSVRAATLATELALNQYKAGTISYLNVSTAQTAELSAKRALLSLENQRYTNAVGLVRALGGGW